MDPLYRQQLAERIDTFLKKHSKMATDGDGWNGPDPSELETAAQILRQGEIPHIPFSEWGSGCYQPYHDKAAQAEHANILQAIRDLKP